MYPKFQLNQFKYMSGFPHCDLTCIKLQVNSLLESVWDDTVNSLFWPPGIFAVLCPNGVNCLLYRNVMRHCRHVNNVRPFVLRCWYSSGKVCFHLYVVLTMCLDTHIALLTCARTLYTCNTLPVSHTHTHTKQTKKK